MGQDRKWDDAESLHHPCESEREELEDVGGEKSNPPASFYSIRRDLLIPQQVCACTVQLLQMNCVNLCQYMPMSNLA